MKKDYRRETENEKEGRKIEREKEKKGRKRI